MDRAWYHPRAPLAGLKTLDAGTIMAAPCASALLADPEQRREEIELPLAGSALKRLEHLPFAYDRTAAWRGR